ncbi:MAG: hypothetical protein MJA32_09575 [Proteobacteria bacterium]|nr:hypothetical protein [Pseudomonadota bacterium]
MSYAITEPTVFRIGDTHGYDLPVKLEIREARPGEATISWVGAMPDATARE